MRSTALYAVGSEWATEGPVNHVGQVLDKVQVHGDVRARHQKVSAEIHGGQGWNFRSCSTA